MSKTNKHLLQAAHCFLELRNDKDMTVEEKESIANDIDDLIIKLTLNLSRGDSQAEYKNDVMQHIRLVQVEAET